MFLFNNEECVLLDGMHIVYESWLLTILTIFGVSYACIRKIQHSNANIHTYQSAATLAGGNYALETIKFLKQCFGILLHTLAS